MVPVPLTEVTRKRMSTVRHNEHCIEWQNGERSFEPVTTRQPHKWQNVSCDGILHIFSPHPSTAIPRRRRTCKLRVDGRVFGLVVLGGNGPLTIPISLDGLTIYVDGDGLRTSGGFIVLGGEWSAGTIRICAHSLPSLGHQIHSKHFRIGRYLTYRRKTANMHIPANPHSRLRN